MKLIDSIIPKLKGDKVTIILPESEDSRVLTAAKIAIEKDICNIILIGDSTKINIDNIKVVDPKIETDLNEKLALELYETRKDKGLTLAAAKELILEDYMYYACLMVRLNLADGVVSGAIHSTANTLRPALQLISKNNADNMVSSFFIMELPNLEDKVLLFSDCGLIQDPTQEQLASIAASSAKSYESIVGDTAKVAMLSHSTKGSAKGPLVEKVVNATNIAKAKNPNLIIDGELQLDAALIPEIAQSKAAGSSIKGDANVLVFPNIDAGNIGYKLVERLAKAKAYGPLTQGLAKPVNDLSRGSSVEDIVGVIAISALQAKENK